MKIKELLIGARDQFLFYSSQHQNKGTEDGDAKAAVNQTWADKLSEALLAMDDVDITQLETIQDYRFGSLTKGQGYAFARGLTISPTHLPEALDAMEKDGWKLLTVFGETTARNIGFIFTWVGTPKRVIDLLESNNTLTARNRSLRAAMREFCDRVDRGEVRSKRTYAKFLELLGTTNGN